MKAIQENYSRAFSGARLFFQRRGAIVVPSSNFAASADGNH